ncbi:MAG: hypothetical protein GY805_34045, partial [Chloroflexi bacterium]|nr:hypothetical protein [Chloroflexota bacterium]
MFSKNLPQDILINIIVLILLSISNSNGSTIVASHESGIQNTASFSIYTVTNTNDSGVGSLRQAITDANNNPGPDTITFNIPSSDPGYANNVWSIQPASLLSSLTGGETTIDATTQTNNQGNTNALGPEVQLDGVNLSSTDWLLSVESNKNVVKGFTIIRGGGAGIQIISTASQNIISDNYIGSDAYGLASFGNGYGVKILGGAWGNQISDCLISGNILDGITIEGIGTDSNILENNLIGLSSFGIAALGNGRHGVSIIDGPKFNLIGGDLPEYNTISGNTLHGVYVTDSDTNIIWNNYIGLDWAGNADLGNGGHGVAVVGGASSNGVQQNIISGNNHHGVYLEGSGTTDNYVRLNFIGSDSQGAAPIPNGWHGVAVYNDAQSNRIGTVSPPWGNVIVSSSWSGVAIINSNQNTVSYNTIGTDENGTATSLGNGYYGVIVEGMNNAIGPDNAIAYNGVDGVRIDGSSYTSQNNTITQNSIYSNTGKGIELWTTGNTELSAPTISQTTCQQVDGTACAGCTVEIFSD